MARTYIPKPPPIDRRVTVNGVLSFIQDYHQFVQNDLDKAGDMEDAAYYQGLVDAYEQITKFICVKRKKEN